MSMCIGMSAIDVSTGQVYVHESFSELNDDKFALDEALRFINSLMPKEIVISKQNSISQDILVEYLALEGKFYQFKEINKEHLKLVFQKKIFEKIYQNRQNLTSIIDTLGLSKTIYARNSLVILLSHVADHYQNLIKNINDPEFYIGSSRMILGNDAINQLNVVEGNITGIPGSVKYHNLLDVINKADTPMGKRYIKLRVVSPYTDARILNDIYDNVNILSTDAIYTEISGYLKKINDIERLYRKISLGLLHPMHMIEFINSFATIADMNVLLSKKIPSIYKKYKILNSMKNIREMNEMLIKMIDIEKAKTSTMSDMKENIFNHGIYEDLDMLQAQTNSGHNVMEELLDKLDSMIDDSKAKSKKIILKHNGRDGYYYQLTTKRYQTLKENLSKITKITLSSKTIMVKDFKSSEINSNIKLTLPFLEIQTDDMDDIQTQVTSLTYKYYTDLLKDICTKYDFTIKKMIDIVSQLDYLVTIAKVSKEYNYCRPTIANNQNDAGFVKAQSIRHPIVERIIEHEYIPHDIDIGSDIKGMMLYGLNSAGKSVLMKAIGLSVIMAQAGFYVPAQTFTFYPFKSLYTRITGNDNIFRGLSSFSLEIVELNSILKRSNESTLVIGDEICRGSEHISGNAIVATTLLKLSELKATYVFATHLHELMELEEIKAKKDIRAYHLSVTHDEQTDRLVYDRILKLGTGEKIYGITVAKYIIKDTEFIKKALEIKNILLDNDNNSPYVSTKKSKYNKDLIMDHCDICDKKNSHLKPTPLETHHINQQKDCDNNDFVAVKGKEHIKKNQIYNLTVLCQDCHDKIHNGGMTLDGIKMTSVGKKLILKKS
jgi:DNA mismatch repair protein MutS